MTTTPSPEEENDRMKLVFKDPAMQAKAVDFLVRKRPIGWGRRSVAPYYKEVFGREAKAVLDEMIKTRKDQVYDYETFQTKFGVNKNTLYLRVNQSILWVVDMMDDENHTYGRFCEMFTIRRKHGIGVVLEFRPECREGNVSDFKPKAVEATEDMPRWMEKLMHFLEEAEVGAQFLKEGLVLTREEIASLEETLTVPGIMANVTSFSVKVLKVPVL